MNAIMTGNTLLLRSICVLITFDRRYDAGVWGDCITLAHMLDIGYNGLLFHALAVLVGSF